MTDFNIEGNGVTIPAAYRNFGERSAVTKQGIGFLRKVLDFTGGDFGFPGSRPSENSCQRGQLRR